MPGNDRHFLLRQIAFDHVQIGAADGAAMHTDPHLARSRLGRRQIGRFQRRRVDRRNVAKEHGFHGTPRPQLYTNGAAGQLQARKAKRM